MSQRRRRAMTFSSKDRIFLRPHSKSSPKTVNEVKQAARKRSNTVDFGFLCPDFETIKISQVQQQFPYDSLCLDEDLDAQYYLIGRALSSRRRPSPYNVFTKLHDKLTKRYVIANVFSCSRPPHGGEKPLSDELVTTQYLRKSALKLISEIPFKLKPSNDGSLFYPYEAEGSVHNFEFDQSSSNYVCDYATPENEIANFSRCLIVGMRKTSSASSNLNAETAQSHSAKTPTPSDDLTPGTCRNFIQEGPVHLSTGVSSLTRYMFLFSDLLLIAKPKSNASYKLKIRLPVNELWLRENIDDVTEETVSADKSFVIGWPTVSYVATFQ
eukprot:gene87-687_t